MPPSMPVRLVNSDGESVNAGEVDILSIAMPSAIQHGKKVVAAAGVAESLAASIELVSGVTVKALASNSGIIYVGGSGVDSTNGFELSAGEQVFVEIDDLASVFVDAATNGDGVSFIGA